MCASDRRPGGLQEDAVFVEAKKPKRHDVMGALRAGMDKLAAATQNTLQAVGSTDIAQRFWVCLQVRSHPCTASCDHIFSNAFGQDLFMHVCNARPAQVLAMVRPEDLLCAGCGVKSIQMTICGWLQEWASALMACLPAAERARARLQVELARMRSRARSVGWSQIALAASLGIMVRAPPC